MKRLEIEQMMKQQGQKTIGIVYNENDELGVYCELKNGFLYDYTGHRVDRKKDIWGYLKYEDLGKGYREPIKVKFEIIKN